MNFALGGARGVVKLVQHLISREADSETQVAITDRLRMWSQGFFGDKHVIYDLEKYASQEYVSDLQMFATRSINGSFNTLLENKLLSEQVFSKYVTTVKSLAVLERGRVHPIPGSTADGVRIDSIDAILDRAETTRGVILKPTGSYGGQGVMLIGPSVDRGPTRERILQLDGYLVQDRLEQSPFANALFPHSINTIRMVTMRHPDSGEVFAPLPVQRIGTVESSPRDNFSAGGLAAEIDYDTGELGQAASRPRGDTLVFHDRHPDTGAQIAGKKIPHWTRIRDGVLAAAQRVEFLDYVGWDIVMRNDGFVILEANRMPGLDILQMHRPLLRDPRVLAFMRAHGALFDRNTLAEAKIAV